MSKASQRRLAKEQQRKKERRKTLDPYHHLIDLVCEMAYKVPTTEKWRLLCERVNPDPPHPDRAMLIEWLKGLAKNHQPILEALRTQAPAPTQDVVDFMALDKYMTITTDFGGRLFYGKPSSPKVGIYWFEPSDEVAFHEESAAGHRMVEALLKSKLAEEQEDRPETSMVACLFLHYEPDLPAFFAGLTATGATAAVVAQDNGIHVARSFAVAETGFELTTSHLVGSEPEEAPNQIELKSLLDTIEEFDPTERTYPSGHLRRQFNGVIGRAVYGQLVLQTALAKEIQNLRDDLAFANDYTIDMADELANRTAQSGNAQRRAYEKRIQQLEALVATLRAAAKPVTLAAPAITHPVKPPPVATMAQKMGAFFGQG